MRATRYDRGPRPMKTSTLKEPAISTHETRTQSTEDYWTDALRISETPARAERRNDSDSHLAALELANGTKDTWLIAQSQNLRTPLMSMGSMLDLMELGQKLARVRSLYEEPSDFDETAFRHLRENFQRLVHFFNELADLTGQSPLQLEGSPHLGTEPSVATFINHDWRGVDSPEGEYPRLENKDYDHN
jgi:hypothetical protein